MVSSSVFMASVLHLADGHGLMVIPPSWATDAGRLGVTGNGLANEGGIDRWYNDNVTIPGEVTIPADSPLRTYKNQTLMSILEWGLVSVEFDRIHREVIRDRLPQEEEMRQVSESRILHGLGDQNLKWTIDDVKKAKVRMENNIYQGADSLYSLFGQDKPSPEDLFKMVGDKDFRIETPADTTKTHPWRAPGTAPITSPCGVFGGNFDGCPSAGTNPEFYPFGDCSGGGSSYGAKAETINFPNVPFTPWQAGSTVEVGWAVSANHGGGYSYRLCKIPEQGKIALTEECFEKTVLKFDGEEQWIQYGDDVAGRTAIPAIRTTEGTYPSGSQWTRNPVAPCQGASGGLGRPSIYGNKNQLQNCQPQFTPHQINGKDLMGFGVNEFGKFVIVDHVHVPENLTPGLYVLSHRWDTEQTAQVWTTCSNIRITAADPVVVV